MGWYVWHILRDSFIRVPSLLSSNWLYFVLFVFIPIGGAAIRLGITWGREGRGAVRRQLNLKDPGTLAFIIGLLLFCVYALFNTAYSERESLASKITLLTSERDTLKSAKDGLNFEVSSKDSEIKRLKDASKPKAKPTTPDIKVYPVRTLNALEAGPKAAWVLTTTAQVSQVSINLKCNDDIATAEGIPMNALMYESHFNKLSSSSEGEIVVRSSPAWMPSSPLWVSVAFVRSQFNTVNNMIPRNQRPPYREPNCDVTAKSESQ